MKLQTWQILQISLRHVQVHISKHSPSDHVETLSRSRSVVDCAHTQAFTLKRRSIGLPRRTPASEAPFSRRTSTSWCWWLRGWSDIRCRFFTFMIVKPETACVSSRTLPFCFPAIANSFSSFNTTQSPATRNNCPCLNSLFLGVKIS